MKEYIAKKVDSRMKIDDGRWQEVEAVLLDYVWDGIFPSPFKTTAQLVHSDEGITVRLSTNEWPITVTAMERNGKICIDSCMEVFFIPNMEDGEYINFEINPAAVSLAAKGAGRYDRQKLDIRGENVTIESHVRCEEGWSVMLFISYEFLLKQYSRVDKEMRANFYKCGDRTETVHYSTWNPVKTEKPDYHRPEYFGKLILSEEQIF